MTTKDENRVILLGAGASAEAGIPVASRLLPEIRRLLGQRADAWALVGPAIDDVTGALQQQNALRGTPFDPLDIESIFAALELLAARDSNALTPFGAFWNPVGRGTTITDTIANARKLARERLVELGAK